MRIPTTGSAPKDSTPLSLAPVVAAGCTALVFEWFLPARLQDART
jgi:hypothetical protein